MIKYIVRHKGRRWSVCMPIDAETLYKCGVDVVTGRPLRHTNEVPHRLRRQERAVFCTRVQMARSRVPACRPGEVRDFEFTDLAIRPAKQGSLARLWRSFNGY